MNIKIDYDKIKNAICCYDLYNALDVIKYFDAKLVTDTKYILMHPKTGQKIFGILMDNAIKGKDKRFKRENLKQRRHTVSYDWLSYAPTEKMDCEVDVLTLYLEDSYEGKI